MAWHSQTPNSLCECIRFTYESGVESIHDMGCRTKAVLANDSHVSRVGGGLKAILDGCHAACISYYVPLIGSMSIQLHTEAGLSTSVGTAP